MYLHTKISHTYWLYSPHCILYTCSIFISARNWYLLISHTYFFSPPIFLPFGSHLFGLFMTVLLRLFICFLDSKYKWGHTGFVFLSLTRFMKRNILWVCPCCHKWQDFILLMAEKSFIAYLHSIFIHLAIVGHAGCFHIWPL